MSERDWSHREDVDREAREAWLEARDWPDEDRPSRREAEADEREDERHRRAEGW